VLRKPTYYKESGLLAYHFRTSSLFQSTF